MNDSNEVKIDFPNLLLLAGNGRNVGKTWLACKLIEQLSKTHDITAIKISSHFHSTDNDNIIIKNDRFIICNEININSKDSSLMLQAGAKKVYFIMAPQQHLEEAFGVIKDELKNEIIICESGGLNEFVSPGIFLFVMNESDTNQKPHLLKYKPIIVKNEGQNIDFDFSRISVENGKFYLR